jgi:hypothetical protein
VSRLDTPQAAADLLARAEQTGDALLAKSIARAAYHRSRDPPDGGGWGGVLDSYASSRPQVAQQIQDLSAAQHNGVTDNVMAAFTFGTAKPDQLRHVPESQIPALAASADAAASAAMIT